MIKEFKALSIPMEKANFHIFPEYCKGCGLCKEKCPNDVLRWSERLGLYGTPVVEPKDEESCIACMICEMVCPDCAIYIERKPKKKIKAGG
jgi:2-oxoglutarate ferredoxin oxidoreductase subunit delta